MTVGNYVVNCFEYHFLSKLYLGYIKIRDNKSILISYNFRTFVTFYLTFPSYALKHKVVAMYQMNFCFMNNNIIVIFVYL